MLIFTFWHFLVAVGKKKKKKLEKSQNRYKVESVYILVINTYIEINTEKITGLFYSWIPNNMQLNITKISPYLTTFLYILHYWLFINWRKEKYIRHTLSVSFHLTASQMMLLFHKIFLYIMFHLQTDYIHCSYLF